MVVHHRGQQPVGLERRARLALGLDGEVVLALAIVAARLHGQDLAVARIDGDERRGRCIREVELRRDRLVRCGLERRVDGGLHGQAAALQRVRAVLVHQQVVHVLDEVRLAHAREPLRRAQAQAAGHRMLVLRQADVALVEHRRQHLVAALQRGGRVQARVVLGRRLGQAGDQRSLADVQLGAVLVEERLRGRLAAVGHAAVGDDVQIGVQDLRLRPVLGHLDRQPGLLDLAVERLRVGQVQVPGQLLLDRRRALHGMPRLDVVQERAGDALVVHAAVLVEALVLDVDGGRLQPGRDLVPGDGGAVLQRRDLGQQVAVAVVDLRGDPGQVGLHRLQVDALQHVGDGHGRADAGRDEHGRHPDAGDGQCGGRERAAAAAALVQAPLAPARGDVAEHVVVGVSLRGAGSAHGAAVSVTASATMPSSCSRATQRSRSVAAAAAACAASGIHTPTVKVVPSACTSATP